MKKTKIVVIGGGTAGCSTAHAINDLGGGYEVTIVEKAPVLGAGVRTYFKGGHPYTFGPRHFLTQNSEIFDYLNSKIKLYNCGHHQFITYVEKDAAFYNYPINIKDVPRMPERDDINKQLENRSPIDDFKNFEEYWIRSVGEILYEKFVQKYNKKMWMLESNKQMDTFKWSPKGVSLSPGDKRALYTHISAYPEALNGYNDYYDMVYDFTNVLLQKSIKKILWDENKLVLEDGEIDYDYLLITISPDIFFDFELGKLDYIGRDLTTIVLPTEFAFPEDVFFTYYAGDEPYTRIVEYKKFTRYKSNSTLLGLEIPSRNGRHYPLPIKREMELAQKYQMLVPENVRFSGRAGSYRYMVDIDDCIEQALHFANWIKEGGTSEGHPVLLEKWQKFV